MKDPNCNNCYKCPFRGTIPGSAHSRCKHPVAEENMTRLITGLMERRRPEISFKNRPYLTINQHGFQSGWAAWPLNFDPLWISCFLPLSDEEIDAFRE
jgi:hypothetical protein